MGKKITQEIYDAAKALLKVNTPLDRIGKTLGFCPKTIRTIDESNDIDDYRRLVNEQFARFKATQEARAKAEQLDLLNDNANVAKEFAPEEKDFLTIMVTVDKRQRGTIAPLTALLSSIYGESNVVASVSKEKNE